MSDKTDKTEVTEEKVLDNAKTDNSKDQLEAPMVWYYDVNQQFAESEIHGEKTEPGKLIFGIVIFVVFIAFLVVAAVIS